MIDAKDEVVFDHTLSAAVGKGKKRARHDEAQASSRVMPKANCQQ